MLFKNSIVRKTFFFAALLIILVTLGSFAVLYFAMPSFYLQKKQQTLQDGLNQLTAALKTAGSQEECAELIVNYTNSYNVMVTALDDSEETILELSTPFVTVGTVNPGIGIYIFDESGEDKTAIINSLELFIQTMTDNRTGESFQITANSEYQLETLIDIDTADTISLTSTIETEFINKIQVEGTLQPIDEAKEVILSLIPYVLFAGITMGLFLAWIYARQISKPILKLSETAVKMQEMEPGILSQLNTDDELGLLSKNLDALYTSLGNTIGNLKLEMEKVNHLEQSKTEMMQSASHELKTPISALSGMLDGMIDNIGAYKNKEKYLLKCKEQVNKLSLLVQEIIQASKIDSEDNICEFTPIALDKMIGQTIQEFALPIKEKQLRLLTGLNPVQIETDPSSFYRVLANLVNNAVLYTPPAGEIRITLTKECLEIENECSPIPPEDIPKLFEPFYTRSSSRNRSVSGTGLGLYIVKRNLERLSIPYEAVNSANGFKITLFFCEAIS